jgi:hypothetical protein
MGRRLVRVRPGERRRVTLGWMGDCPQNENLF